MKAFCKSLIIAIGLLVLAALPARAQTTWGRGSTNLANQVTGTLGVSNGGTGATTGAQSQISCVIPDTAALGTIWCDTIAGRGNTIPTFDTITVRGYAACTTFPAFEIVNVTHAGTSAAVTGSATVASLSIDAQVGGAGVAATDDYAIEISTAGSGCSTTLATEFFTVTASVRQ